MKSKPTEPYGPQRPEGAERSSLPNKVCDECGNYRRPRYWDPDYGRETMYKGRCILIEEDHCILPSNRACKAPHFWWRETARLNNV